jgi:hypothetical protein
MGLVMEKLVKNAVRVLDAALGDQWLGPNTYSEDSECCKGSLVIVGKDAEMRCWMMFSFCGLLGPLYTFQSQGRT